MKTRPLLIALAIGALVLIVGLGAVVACQSSEAPPLNALAAKDPEGAAACESFNKAMHVNPADTEAMVSQIKAAARHAYKAETNEIRNTVLTLTSDEPQAVRGEVLREICNRYGYDIPAITPE